MRGRIALAALVASLLGMALGSTAEAANFRVDETGDSPAQTVPNGQCSAPPGGCTLREAVLEANATPAADSIDFADGLVTVMPAAQLPSIVAPVRIEGGGDITIAPSAPIALPLILITEGATSGAGSTLRELTIDGDPTGPGRAGPLVRVGVNDVTLDRVTLKNSADDGIEVAAAAQRVKVTRSPVFAYAPGREAIALEPGANNGIASPQNLRVGPRRGDGTLPVTGTAADGVVELFRGDPETGPQSFVTDSPGGSFAVLLGIEPTPGEKVSATVTDPAGDTSAFATATTSGDVVSPALLGGFATSLSEVRLQPSEPLDPSSVQVGDFSLVMAGSERPLGGLFVAPDGSSVTLQSSTPWLNGEAGTITFRTPSAVTDISGNQNLQPGVVRVGGAPGDFIAPAVTSLKVSPKSRICISKGPRCKKPGTYVSFISSEDGEAVYTFFRGKRTIGTRRYAVKPGRNRIRFDGRIRGRKMTAGRYTLRVGVEDAVGNITALQPRYAFSIRSTSSKR
jgi:hypothetical protein